MHLAAYRRDIIRLNNSAIIADVSNNPTPVISSSHKRSYLVIYIFLMQYP
jgi:hypothetical protein